MLTRKLGYAILVLPSILGILRRFLVCKRSILEAAQREGTLGVDEGSKRMKDQVYFFGNMIFTVTYIILACFSLITSTELNTGVTAMFLASITGGLFARWRLSGIKAHLFPVFDRRSNHSARPGHHDSRYVWQRNSRLAAGHTPLLLCLTSAIDRSIWCRFILWMTD